jgi:hypothetical protein
VLGRAGTHLELEVTVETGDNHSATQHSLRQAVDKQEEEKQEEEE